MTQNESDVLEEIIYPDVVTESDKDGSISSETKSSTRSKASQSAIIYIVCATIAVSITAVSSETRLWKSSSDWVLDYEVLCELLTIFIIVLFSFWAVRGSNPGYLDQDVMKRFSDLDSLPLDRKQMPSKEIRIAQLASAENVTCRKIHPNSSGSLHARSSVDEADVDDDEETCPLNSDEMSPSPISRKSTRRKYCSICEIAPPLRAHHCKICQKCVATFDHHCIFIGTCIGERNHCRFWWFLSAQMIGFFVCCNIVSSSPFGFQNLFFDFWHGHRQQEQQDQSYFFLKNVTVLLSKLYLYPLLFAAVSMWIIHTFLAVVNSTTFEWGKGAAHIDYLKEISPMNLPFSKSLDGNLRLFCCMRDGTIEIITASNKKWVPILWRLPEKIDYDTADWWDSPCNNKYWSCC